MKALINAIIAFLDAAIYAQTITATTTIKGFNSGAPDEVPIEKYPYIAVDDGGERVEAQGYSSTSQLRVYSVELFFAVIIGEYEDSLDAILDLTDQVKTTFEKAANRQLDGHNWGVTVEPIEGAHPTGQMWRGRRIVVEYTKLEDREYTPY